MIDDFDLDDFDDEEGFDIDELLDFEAFAGDIVDAANHRIHYGCHSIQVRPRTKIDEYKNWYIPAGVQEINLTTSFDLQNLFELGQIDIYDQIEGVPTIELEISKIFDGTPSIYSMTMCGSSGISGVNDRGLPEVSNNQVDFQLGVWSDQISSTTGEASSWTYCSGMYVKSIEYNFSIDSVFTEKISLIGYTKLWNQNSPMEDKNINFSDPYWRDLGTQALAPPHRTTFSLEYPQTILPTGSGGINIPPSNIHLQNINVQADFTRTKLLELGRFSPYHSIIEFPVEITTQISTIGTIGDYADAIESYEQCQVSKQLAELPIKLCICNNGCVIGEPGSFIIDLGSKNKLSSVNHGGGGTGDDNVIITYEFKTFNNFKIIQSGSYNDHNLVDNLPRLLPLAYEINTTLSDNKFIQLPIDSLTNSTINWGDCTHLIVDDTPVSLPNHTYGKHGQYLITVSPKREIVPSGTGTIYITGMLSGILQSSNFINLDSVTACYSFGSYTFPSLDYSFANLKNLHTLPYNMPNSVTGMEGMLENSSKFNNSVIGNWDTSNVKNMRAVFKDAIAFNASLYWDTAKVQTMQSMFENARVFNGDISSFVVTGVKFANKMFYNASGFNQDISNWSCNNMFTTESMFENAISFNKDIKWGHIGPSECPSPSEDPYAPEIFSTAKNMFKNAISMNGEIDLDFSMPYSCNGLYGPETTSGVNLFGMFCNANKLTGNTGFQIVTTKIADASLMFSGAALFHTDSLSSVTATNNTKFSIRSIFDGASSFSGNLHPSWTSGISGNMSYAFRNASAFNSNSVTGWDTNPITNMLGTFDNATSFVKDISKWSIDGLTLGSTQLLENFMRGVTLPTIDPVTSSFIPSGYYTDLLINWYSGVPVGLIDQTTSFGTSRYFSRACEARTALVEPTGEYRWIIQDGGMVPCEWYNVSGVSLGVAMDCSSILSPPSGAIDCTPIYTLSATPTPTPTPSVTVTNTPSATVTTTPTLTPTSTISPTPTQTMTVTPTSTVTNTPTLSSTLTPTPSFTPTYTSSPTPTPTVTQSPT